jgi:hypothetical protein
MHFFLSGQMQRLAPFSVFASLQHQLITSSGPAAAAAQNANVARPQPTDGSSKGPLLLALHLVCNWHKADILAAFSDVRFRG